MRLATALALPLLLAAAIEGVPVAAQDQVPAAGQQGQAGQDDDALIATVDGAELRKSDVLSAIDALPPRLRQTPPEMLIPAVVDQLVLRTLILDQARSDDLQDDPEVKEMVDTGAAPDEERALVVVWVQRVLEERVTDADVERAFDELKATDPDTPRSLEEARPELEQALQRQAMVDVGAELREQADVVFYGPGGAPTDPDGAGSAGGQPPSAD